MQGVRVVWYREGRNVPFLEWLQGLERRARDKSLARLSLLERYGHLLRRPIADYVDDGIWELRARHMRTQLRILYFFHGDEAIVVSHGFAKPSRRIPRAELDLARLRRRRFENDTAGHSFRPEA